MEKWNINHKWGCMVTGVAIDGNGSKWMKKKKIEGVPQSLFYFVLKEISFSLISIRNLFLGHSVDTPEHWNGNGSWPKTILNSFLALKTAMAVFAKYVSLTILKIEPIPAIT